MKKIIGVLGKPGAGKDTFCDFFQEIEPSVKVLKFSDTLSDILRMFFDEIKREDQQWLINALRDHFGEDILAKAIKKKIKEETADFILLNGVRVWDDYQLIKDLGGQLVFIAAKPELRWERMKKRKEKKDDDVSYQKFLELDSGRSELEVEKIGELSDNLIDNNNTKEDLKKEVLNIIKKYK